MFRNIKNYSPTIVLTIEFHEATKELLANLVVPLATSPTEVLWDQHFCITPLSTIKCCSCKPLKGLKTVSPKKKFFLEKKSKGNHYTFLKDHLKMRLYLIKVYLLYFLKPNQYC